MTKTVPADYIGEPNLGYVIVAMLSENTRSRLGTLLDDLTHELPGALWRMPPEQMHLTLCEIIQPKSYTQDKEALFNLNREEYENTPRKILSALPKFSITLDTIEVSPHAIIARGRDSTSFNLIRAQLLQNMQLPAETRTPPDITHSSIARYLREVDLDRVQGVVAKHSISITEGITEFKLLKTMVMPLEKYETLKTYSLA